MSEGLRVGDVLHGYCGGVFGRIFGYCRRVEAIGSDWVIARTINLRDGAPNVAWGDPQNLTQYRSLDDRYDCTCEPGEGG